MPEHKPLPVLGYKAHSDETLAEVNGNKVVEENILRTIDEMMEVGAPTYDPRMLAIARTKIQEAYMWLNRAIMQPSRIRLDGDE